MLTSSPYKDGLEQKKKKINPVTQLEEQNLTLKRFANLPPCLYYVVAMVTEERDARAEHLQGQ